MPRTRPHVSVVFTGGISMTLDPATGLATPSLMEGLVPASHLRLGQVLEIARLIRSQLERDDVDGVVVVQGTDVLDETAFAWDLLLDTPRPVVIVGAMRSAGDPDDDGPANLRDAITAAASPKLAGEGVVVVMDGHIWPADDVTKTHTDPVDALGAR